MTVPDTNTCRSRLHITPRGQITVMLLHLAAGAAWLSGDASVRLAASMLAAPVVLDLLWKLATRPKLALALRPRRGVARSAFRESLQVQNLASHSAVRDLHLREPRTGSGAEGGGAHLPWIAPHASVEIEFSGRHPRRGVQVTRSFEAESFWPLGMFRWRLELSTAALLLSEPVRVPLVAPESRTEDVAQSRTPSRRGDAEEFYALREYRDGEDARRVHGRRSAALGTLVLAVWRGREVEERTLIVDMRRAPGLPDLGLQRRVEHRLGCAAWLVDRWVGEGRRFEVVAVDRTVQRWRVQDRATARAVLAWLAATAPVPYRALSDADRRGLEVLPNSLWIAAGGHSDRDRTARRDRSAHPAGEVLA